MHRDLFPQNLAHETLQYTKKGGKNDMNKVTSYLKNVGKSISYATVDVSLKLIPDLQDFVDTNEELFKSVYAAAIRPDKTIKTGKQMLLDSKIYKDVRKGIDNALDDIKTGNFYNKERYDAAIDSAADFMSGAGDDFFKDNGLDDFGDFESFDFGDDDEFDEDSSSSSKSSVTKGDLIVADSVAASGNATAQLISKTVANSSTSIIKGNIASTNALMAQNINLISGVRTSISGVQQSINAILEFANTQVVTGLNNQATFFDKTTSLMQENNAILKEMLEMQRNKYEKERQAENSGDQFSNVFNGSLDLVEYFKAIKKNIVRMDPTGMLSTMNSDDGMLATMLSNPFESLITGLVKGFMPTKTVKSIMSFNKTLGNLFPALMSKLNVWKDDFGAKSIIGKIFGLRGDTKKKIDPSKYTKGAVPFDGITKRAIVDVIPEYLSKIESYLSKQSQRVYDYESGTWTTAKAIKEQSEKSYKTQVIDASFDEFNKNFERFANELKKNKYFNSKSDYDNFFKEWDEVRKYTVEDLQGHFNINMLKEEMHTLSEEMTAFLDQVAKGPLSKILGVSGKVFDNKRSYAARINNAENGIDTLRKTVDKSNMDDHLIYDNTFKDTVKDSKVNLFTTNLDPLNNYSIFDYLRSMDMNLAFVAEGGIGLGQRFEDDVTKMLKLDRARSRGYYDIFTNQYKLAPQTSFFNKNLTKKKEEADRVSKSFKNNYTAKDGEEINKKQVLSNAANDLEKKNTDIDSDELNAFGRFLQKKNKWQKQAEQIPGDTFSEKFANAQTMNQKFTVIMSSLTEVAKKPANILDSLINKANNSIYDMLFKQETDEVEQKSGKKIKGLFNKMLNEMQHHWTILTTNLSKKIIDPLAKKLGLNDKWDKVKQKLKESTVGKKWSEIKDEFKDSFLGNWLGVKNYVKGAVNDVVIKPFKETETGANLITKKNESKIKSTKKAVSNTLSQLKGKINTNEQVNLTTDILSKLERSDHIPLSVVGNYANAKRQRDIYLAELRRQKEEELGTKNLPLSVLTEIANKVNKMNFGDLEKVEETKKPTSISPIKSNPITWNGVNYPSERAMCKALGLNYNKFQYRKQKGLPLEDCIAGSQIEGLALGELLNKGTKITVSSPDEIVGVVRKKKASKKQIEEDEKNENQAIDILHKTLGEEVNIKGFANEGVHIGDENEIFKTVNKDIERNISHRNKLRDQNKNLQKNKEHTALDTGVNGVKNELESLGSFLMKTGSKIYHKITGEPVKEETANQEQKSKDPKKSVKETTTDIIKEMEGKGIDTTVKGIYGGAIGLLAGGPLVGAAVGVGSALFKNSQTVQQMLYGKDVTFDENGYIVEKKNDKDGLLSKNTYNTLKKHLPDIGKFGTVGAITGLFSPLGPIVGAALGAGIGIMKNSSTLNEMLFGDEDGLINAKRKEKIKKYFPKAGAGALIGVAGGMLLGGPFGLLGNAVLGSSIGLLTGTEEFKNLIMGEEDSNGDRVGGLTGVIREHIIDPLTEFGSNFKDDFFGFMKESIIDPLDKAITPITSEIAYQTKKVVFGIPKMFMGLAKDHLYKPIADVINTSVVQPISNLTKKLFGGLFSGIKGIVSLPFRAIGRLGDNIRKKQIRKGRDEGTAKERIQFAQEKQMGDYRYRGFDEALAEASESGDEGYLKNITARTAMLAHGPKYFEKEVKRTGRKLSNIVADYARVGLLNKGSREYKKIMEAIKKDDIETAIKLINQIKDTKKGGRLSDEDAAKAIQELKDANQNYQAARKARDEMSNINEEENREWLRKQFGDEIVDDPKKLYTLANRELANLTGKGLSAKDVLDPNKEIGKVGTILNDTLTDIRDILLYAQTGIVPANMRDKSLSKQLADDAISRSEAGRKGTEAALAQRKEQKNNIKNRLSSKGFETFKDEKGNDVTDDVISIFYSNEKLYQLFLYAWDEDGTPYDKETIVKLNNLKLTDEQISILKENPAIAKLPEEMLKKHLNPNRNNHASVLHSKGIQRKNAKQLAKALKAGVKIENEDQARMVTSGSYAEKYQHDERINYFRKFQELGLLDIPLKRSPTDKDPKPITQEEILDINKGLTFKEMDKIIRYNNGKGGQFSSVENSIDAPIYNSGDADFSNVLSNFKEKTNLKGKFANFVDGKIFSAKNRRRVKKAGKAVGKGAKFVGSSILKGTGYGLKGTNAAINKYGYGNLRDLYRFGFEGFKDDKAIGGDIASDFGDFSLYNYTKEKKEQLGKKAQEVGLKVKRKVAPTLLAAQIYKGILEDKYPWIKEQIAAGKLKIEDLQDMIVDFTDEIPGIKDNLVQGTKKLGRKIKTAPQATVLTAQIYKEILKQKFPEVKDKLTGKVVRGTKKLGRKIKTAPHAAALTAQMYRGIIEDKYGINFEDIEDKIIDFTDEIPGKAKDLANKGKNKLAAGLLSAQMYKGILKDKLLNGSSVGEKVKTILTEHGPIKYIKDKRDNWKLARDTQTQKSLLESNEEERNQHTMIDHLKSMKDGIFGIFSRHKQKDDEEKKEPWYKKLFGFDLSTIGGKLKLGGVLLGGLTAIGAIKNAWDDEGENGIMHKIANKVGGVLSPLFDKLKEGFSGITDWFTSSGKHEGGGLTKFMEDHVFPNLFTGMNVVFGKVLPAMVEAFIVNIPKLIKSALKGVASLFNPFNKDEKDDANVSISDFKTVNGSSKVIDGVAEGATQVATAIRQTVVNDKGVVDNLSSTDLSGTTDNKKVNNSKSKTKTTVMNDKGVANSATSVVQNSIQNTPTLPTTSQDEPIMFDGIGNIYKDKECTNPVMSNEFSNGLITEFYNEHGGHWVSDGSGGYTAADDSTRNIHTKRGIPERVMAATARSVLSGRSLGIGRVIKFAGKSKILRSVVGASDKIISKIPFIGRTYKLGKAGVQGAANIAQNVSEATARFGNKALTKAGKEATEKVGKEAAEKIAKQGAKSSIHNSAENIVKQGLKTASGLLERVVKWVKDGLESIFKNNTILNKIKEGLKTSGKKATKETAEEAAEGIIKKFVKMIPQKLTEMGSEVLAKISASISTAGLVTLAFAAVDFITGMDRAEAILGIKETNFVQEIIAGLVNTISGLLFFGLIPSSFIVDILVDIVFPIFQIDMEEYKKDRAEADKLREEYNRKYGADLSTEEYLAQENSATGKVEKFFAGYKKRAKENKQKSIVTEDQVKSTNITSTIKPTIPGLTNIPTTTTVPTTMPTSNAMNTGFGSMFGKGTNDTLKDKLSARKSLINTSSISNDNSQELSSIRSAKSSSFYNGIKNVLKTMTSIKDANSKLLSRNNGKDATNSEAVLETQTAGLNLQISSTFTTLASDIVTSMDLLSQYAGKILWGKGTLSQAISEFKNRSNSTGTSVYESISGLENTSFTNNSSTKSSSTTKKSGGLFSGLKSIFGFGSGFVSQLDPKYKNKKFNIPGDTQMQTLGDSGCAPAVAANVLNMYAGKGMDDASRAALKYKGQNSGVTPDYFTDYLGQNGISTYPTMDKQQMLNGIASGQPTILLGMDPSNRSRTPYGSSSSHYVVATGLDGKGNVIIQDPESRKPNALYPIRDVINKSHFGMLTGRGKGSRRNKNSNFRKRLPKFMFGKGYSKTVHKDLAKFSKITASELNKHIPSGTGFSGKGQYFINASNASGLDPRYILAHAAQETGWGNSELAKAGNFFGIGAFNDNPNNGFKYGNSSMESGLINGAKWIRENYYDIGQKTLYQMIHPENGWHHYAVDDHGNPNIHWMESIASIMDSIGDDGSAVYHEADESVTASSSTSEDTSEPRNIFEALQKDIFGAYDPKILEFFGYTSSSDETTSNNGSSNNGEDFTLTGKVSTNAKEFYNNYIGKAVDYDGMWGAQCSDLFKQYLHDVVGISGYAHPRDGAESIASDSRLNPYFNKVSLDKAQYGDWLVWGPGSFPGEYSKYGHVGMFVKRDNNGKILTFGGNQNSTVSNVVPLTPNGISAVLRYKDQEYSTGQGSNAIKSTRFLSPNNTKFTGKGTNQLPKLNFKSSYGTDSYDTTAQLGASTTTSTSNSKVEKLISVVIEILGTIAENSSKLSEIVSLLSRALDVELTTNDISKLKSNNAQIKNKLANALKSQGSANGMGNTVTNASTESLAAAMYAIARA